MIFEQIEQQRLLIDITKVCTSVHTVFSVMIPLGISVIATLLTDLSIEIPLSVLPLISDQAVMGTMLVHSTGFALLCMQAHG